MALGKTIALPIIWFILIVTFVMPLPKKPTLIWKKLRKHGVLSDPYDLDFQGPLTGPSWSWVHSV